MASLFTLDAGIPVSGDIRAGAGAGTPVSGARVLLRAGGLPSTIGASDGAGAFELRARPGTWSGVVLPPPGSTLPEAHVDSGIPLDGGAASLRFQWRRPAERPPRRGRDRAGRPGHHPPGARAHRGRAGLAARRGHGLPVGSQARAGQRLPAPGRHHRRGRHRHLLQRPGRPLPGHRHPPAGAADVAITAAPIEAGTGQPQRITLARPVALTGSVLPAALSSGLQVVALDTEGSSAGESVTATVDEAGQFSLAVAPGRQLPPADRARPGAQAPAPLPGRRHRDRRHDACRI